MSQMEQFLGSLKTADSQRREAATKEAQQSNLRREYAALMQGADPAHAGRLLQVADALGQDMAAVEKDLAHFHPTQPASPAAAPAPDLSKMSGMQLLKLGAAQQTPVNFDGTNLPDVSKMNHMQLLTLGDSFRTPRHPDGTSPEPAA